MRFKTRYRYWHVMLVFFALGFLAMIAYFLTSMSESTKEVAEKITENESKKKSLPGSGIQPLLGFFYYVTFFYFTLNYYYNLLAANKRFGAFFKTSWMIVLAAFIYHLFLYYFLPGALMNEYSSPVRMFFVMLGNMIPPFVICYIIAYATISREALKQRHILEAQKLQLETQISQANFNFLKAQINPHFLHNTLNFLYAKSLPYSPELSEGIVTLSDIMRYALSQGNQKDGKAPLKDEIEHVQNVIKISQLRFSNKLKVNFVIEGNVEGLMIIPFVLITLVENAFKHGDLKNPDYPIDIKLRVGNGGLYFRCTNKKKSGPKQLASGGIGLDNIKKRLELAYGEKHKFIISNEADFYTTELIIEKL